MVVKQSADNKIFWQPRYWLAWCGIAILWLVAKLPYRLAMISGNSLGLLTMKLLPSRRRIVLTNLALCFPHYSRQQCQQLMRLTFRALGRGLVEAAIAWWGSPRYIDKLTYNISGLSMLKEKIAAKQRVLLVSPHLYTLEIGGRIIGDALSVGIVYQVSSNLFFHHLIEKKRAAFFTQQIRRGNLKSFFKAIKNNLPIIYLPDQDFGPRNSIFASFFGVSTATATATARIAELTQAQVMFIYCLPRKDKRGYEVVIKEPLANFPSDDALQDANHINHCIEEIVKLQPENYMWVHRRFKTRPPGEEWVY